MQPDDPTPTASDQQTPSPSAGEGGVPVQALAPVSSASGESSGEQQQPTHWLFNRENLVTVVMALALALLIRTFIAEARWIPSASMVPTLQEGDRLVVEKVSYRFSQPKRGDIIVFRPPAETGFEGAYIKRIIGLPGDRMRIQNGQVFINGTPVQEDYIKAPPLYDCPGEGDPGSGSFCERENGADFMVPEDAYFVMGDNRNDSQDSHVWGFLPADNIIGHTILRFWPLNRLHYFRSVSYPELSSHIWLPLSEDGNRWG